MGMSHGIENGSNCYAAGRAGQVLHAVWIVNFPKLDFLTSERVVENDSKLKIYFTSFLDRNREGQLGVHKALRSPNKKRYITQSYSC